MLNCFLQSQCFSQLNFLRPIEASNIEFAMMECERADEFRSILNHGARRKVQYARHKFLQGTFVKERLAKLASLFVNNNDINDN